MRAVALVTPRGTVFVEEVARPVDCAGCDRHDQGRVEVVVDTVAGTEAPRLVICGSCLAQAVALFLLGGGQDGHVDASKRFLADAIRKRELR